MPRDNPKPADLDFEFGVICDHIRQETNGKFILIGVYTPDVQVQELPTTFAFSIFAKASSRSKEDFEAPFSIRVLRNGEEVSRRDGRLSHHYNRSEKRQRNIYLALEGLLLLTEEECKADVEFRLDKGEWRNVASFELTAANASSST